MWFGIIADNPLEAVGPASGMVPTPTLEPYASARLVRQLAAAIA